MSGRPFSYTVAPSGGSSFSVGPINGGRCSGPITLSGSTATITEAQSDPATDVSSISVRPSIRKLSEDLGNRRVTVTTGLSTSSETLVTFTNKPAGGNFAALKVCKLTETPAYLGRLFSFSVNGGSLVSTEANDAFADPSSYSCRILGTFQVGTIVTVHEQIPPGTEIQWIDTDPGANLLDFNTATGDSTILIGPVATIVYYDNEPTPPNGTGFLEICKDAALVNGVPDPFVLGYPFDFHIDDGSPNGHDVTVLGGQCSEPIPVQAGVLFANYVFKPIDKMTPKDIFTIPGDRLLSANLTNESAQVEVPASDDPNDETQLHFVNEKQRGQLKICKALGPGSGALDGQEFVFDVVDLDGFQRDPLNPRVVASSSGTQCVIVGYFPIGHHVRVGEQNPGEFIDVSGEGTVTIAPGVNTITITNTAKGLLELCKARINFGPRPIDVPAPAQPYFYFRVDNGALIKLQAGKCTLPMRVPVGDHFVSEMAAADYEIDPDAPGGGITGEIAGRSTTLKGSKSNSSERFAVPYAASEGEFLVTFYNRVKRGMVKVCKVIPLTSQDSLGGKDFTYTVTIDGVMFTLGPIKPGECTNFSRAFPILNALGQPQVVTVHEDGTPSDTWDVTSITCTGCKSDPGRPPKVMTAEGTIEFDLGPGINVVTYTNKAKDP